MKKIVTLVVLFLIISEGYAYTQHNLKSANFLAGYGIINDNSENVSAYNLSGNITRREMLKVMMKLSGKTVIDSCSGKFSDMNSTDWGCKYAEAALNENYIAANNTFRPGDNVTRIEALKMIMQAKGVSRDENEDWRAGYVSKAQSEDFIDEGYFEYDGMALRGFIFSTGARTYDDFTFTTTQTQTTGGIDPDVEKLLEEIFDL